MNEQQLTALIERVGDTLDPDVGVLVAGGAARGRTRRRHRRVGVAAGGLVAAAVLIGVATLADAGGSDTPVATDPTPVPSVPAVSEPRAPIAREDVPAAFESLFPGDVSGPLDGEGAVTDFRWNGYWVRVVVEDAVLPDLRPGERCLADSDQPSCVTLPNGTAATALAGRGEPRSHTYRSASGYTPDGFDLSIIISNATGSKSGEVLSRWAPITESQLVEAVASDVWFG